MCLPEKFKFGANTGKYANYVRDSIDDIKAEYDLPVTVRRDCVEVSICCYVTLSKLEMSSVKMLKKILKMSTF
jgi:hypothetical protein